MTSQAGSPFPPGRPQPSGAPGDREAFAELFDRHARHLFDYCYALLGERSRAASATQVTLIAAHSLSGRLTDTSRKRAWVLALGRWECLSGGHGQPGRRWSGAARRHGTDELAAALAFVDEADTGIISGDTGELTLSDFEAASGLSLRALLLTLPREDREVLDLVYRHGVSMADLPAVLGQPAASVASTLAAARAKFATQASALAGLTAAGPDSSDGLAGRLATVKLATMPPSVWRRTARVVLDPRFQPYSQSVVAHADHLGPDGFPVQSPGLPSGRKLLMASAMMAGLLLAPAATGGVVYAAFSTLAHAAAHEHIVLTPGSSGSDPATSGLTGAGAGSSSGGARHSGSKAKDNPAEPRPRPRASASRSAKPSASAKPTSRYSTSPFPSPSSSTPSPSTSSPSPSPSASSPSPSASSTSTATTGTA